MPAAEDGRRIAIAKRTHVQAFHPVTERNEGANRRALTQINSGQRVARDFCDPIELSARRLDSLVGRVGVDPEGLAAGCAAIPSTTKFHGEEAVLDDVALTPGFVEFACWVGARSF